MKNLQNKTVHIVAQNRFPVWKMVVRAHSKVP